LAFGREAVVEFALFVFRAAFDDDLEGFGDLFWFALRVRVWRLIGFGLHGVDPFICF
jgi:hypothetical protein